MPSSQPAKVPSWWDPESPSSVTPRTAQTPAGGILARHEAGFPWSLGQGVTLHDSICAPLPPMKVKVKTSQIHIITPQWGMLVKPHSSCQAPGQTDAPPGRQLGEDPGALRPLCCVSCSTSWPGPCPGQMQGCGPGWQQPGTSALRLGRGFTVQAVTLEGAQQGAGWARRRHHLCCPTLSFLPNQPAAAVNSRGQGLMSPSSR